MGLKHFKRADIYKNSTGSNHFDPSTCKAHSYEWWCYVDKINGKVIFNDYSYSPSTSTHQWDMRSLLRDLGIKIDHKIEAPGGLDNVSRTISLYKERVKSLRAEIAKPRSHKRKNQERQAEIKNNISKLEEIAAIWNIKVPLTSGDIANKFLKLDLF